ncbi:MAG: hypothetical protein K2I30_05005 [Clostridia bacterium]|nr:hypothetical protein [Clostridia bacterium]
MKPKMTTKKDEAQKQKEKNIKELSTLAKEVLELKNTHRQMRPIIIEFSGSPKSGKTSSIGSLQLFLKRNQFKVEVIQEKASICPVADKQNYTFNVWTAYQSLVDMLAILDRKSEKPDILIIDRGIFDAMCWFEWLYKIKRLTKIQKNNIEAPLLMEEFTKQIDIIFAFESRPEVSLNREYAKLLLKPDQTGTIMNNQTLGEYQEAIHNTINIKKKYFHNIIPMDTSDMDQNDVSYEVTKKVLSTLKETLMERIGYFVPSSEAKEYLMNHRIIEFDEFNKILNGSLKFDLREKVEINDEAIQPIPIVVITDYKAKRVLTVKKTTKAVSDDDPEKDKLLIYIGGHTRIEDKTDKDTHNNLSIFNYTLLREMREEIGVNFSLENTTPFCIYTPDLERSKRHIAICYHIKVDDKKKLTIDSEELIQNRGKSKSGKFLNINELIENENESLEAWSIEIIKKCFGINVKLAKTQISFFDFQ